MDRVITISRQHGSGGRQIGRLLSEKLNIPFYDKEIIAHAAEQSGIHGSHFDLVDQSDMSGPAYLISPGVAFELPLRDKVYLAQRSAILKIASKGPCVIVGRGAGEVLNGKVPLLRVFVYADRRTRIQRAVEQYHEPAETIEKRIDQIDKRRMAYYSFYEQKTGLFVNHFDLCIDSDKLGIDQAVRIILAACE